jgi:hypothetical protein
MAILYNDYMKAFPNGRPYKYSDDADDVSLPGSERERLYREAQGTWKDYVKNPIAMGATPLSANIPTFEQWAARNPQIVGDNNPEYQYLQQFYKLPNKSDIWETVLPMAGMAAMGAAAGGAFGNLSTYGSAGGTFGTAASTLPESYWSMTAEGGGTMTDAAAANAGTVSAPNYSLGTLPNTTQWTQPFTLSEAMTVPNAGFATTGATVNLANSATLVPSSGGGMFEGFFKDLLKPSNLLNIGGQVYSAITGKGAAEDALAGQLAASAAATGEQRRQYDQTRTDMEPWRQAGTMAIGELGGLTLSGGPLGRRFTMDDFMSDPVTKAGFQFGLDEGRKALERRAAASGSLDSGATLKALTRFGTDYGNQKAGESYNRFTQDQTNLFNRLATLSGIGQTSAAQVANAGTNMANNVSNMMVGEGNARAASSIAGSNAVTNAVNNVGNWLQTRDIMSRMPVYRMS